MWTDSSLDKGSVSFLFPWTCYPLYWVVGTIIVIVSLDRHVTPGSHEATL